MRQKHLFEAFLYEETSIRVCEEMGPNAIDYDRRHDQLMEDRDWRFAVHKEYRRRRRNAANDPLFKPVLRGVQ